MKRIVLAISVVAALTALTMAQKTSTRADVSASNETSLKQQGRQIDLESGTQLAAQLESTLDARHAKPGDRVVLKTTKAVKQNGQVVIEKGARLIGRVTDVQEQTKTTGESHIGLVFDRLRSGSSEIPITATILSITQARTRTQTSNTDFESDTMARSTATTSASSPRSSKLWRRIAGWRRQHGGRSGEQHYFDRWQRGRHYDHRRRQHGRSYDQLCRKSNGLAEWIADYSIRQHQRGRRIDAEFDRPQPPSGERYDLQSGA